MRAKLIVLACVCIPLLFILPWIVIPFIALLCLSRDARSTMEKAVRKPGQCLICHAYFQPDTIVIRTRTKTDLCAKHKGNVAIDAIRWMGKWSQVRQMRVD